MNIFEDIGKHTSNGIYLDLMPAPKDGEIALVTCDKDGENIEPVLIFYERNGEVIVRLVQPIILEPRT
jgi:hypothetical protein